MLATGCHSAVGTFSPTGYSHPDLNYGVGYVDAAKQALMKEWTNSRFYNVVSWTSVALMIGLTLALVAISLKDMLGGPA